MLNFFTHDAFVMLSTYPLGVFNETTGLYSICADSSPGAPELGESGEKFGTKLGILRKIQNGKFTTQVIGKHVFENLFQKMTATAGIAAKATNHSCKRHHICTMLDKGAHMCL